MKSKNKISLRIHADWSESTLSAWRHCASLTIQNAPSEDSDQTAQRGLIWIFAGRMSKGIGYMFLYIYKKNKNKKKKQQAFVGVNKNKITNNNIPD